MPSQASKILSRSSVSHFSMPELGYTLCVGCIAEAGQDSTLELFTNLTVSPTFTLKGLGENPVLVKAITFPVSAASSITSSTSSTAGVWDWLIRYQAPKATTTIATTIKVVLFIYLFDSVYDLSTF